MSALAVSPLINSGRVDDPRRCEPGDMLPEAPEKIEITRQKPEPDQQMLGF
jgi:hypothetical protein